MHLTHTNIDIPLYVCYKKDGECHHMRPTFVLSPDVSTSISVAFNQRTLISLMCNCVYHLIIIHVKASLYSITKVLCSYFLIHSAKLYCSASFIHLPKLDCFSFIFIYLAKLQKLFLSLFSSLFTQ